MQVIIDEKTGFPLLHINDLSLTTFLLPITNVQLELFLSDVTDMRFDANWYKNQVLNNKDNPRVSIHQITNQNIHHHLATNILLSEIKRIANWFGHYEGQVYDLPTANEWSQLLNFARSMKPIDPVHDFPSTLDVRAKAILVGLWNTQKPKTLASQMLLGGKISSVSHISEYVYQDNTRQTCQLTGRTLTEFVTLSTNSGDRRPYLTFRFIRRSI